MMNVPIYGKNLYNCCISNALMLKLGYNSKVLLVDMKRATEMEIAVHVIRPANVIPTRQVKPRVAQLLIIIYRLWTIQKMVEERRERRMVGQRMMLVLM